MHFDRIQTGKASALHWRLAFLVFLLLAPACVTITPRSQKVGGNAVTIPNVPMHRWGIESCGAGSLATVLQHYGDGTSMRTWDTTLPKTRGGVMTIDMLLAARQKGFDARLVTGDAASVSRELQEQRPVILMLQVVDSPGHHYDFFHYVVADGIDAARGLIRTQWGDRKPRWVTFEKLEKPWAGGGHAAIFIHPRSPSGQIAAGTTGQAPVQTNSPGPGPINDPAGHLLNDPISDQLRAAVALEEDGKYAEAAAVYRSLLSSHPGSALVWTNLGNTDLKLGKRTEAEEDFRSALRADPSSRDAMNNLAWLLFEQKRLDEAESLARKAVAQPGPDNYLVLDTLGRILAARGACNEAQTTFDQALASVPESQAAARDGIRQAMSDARSSCHS